MGDSEDEAFVLPKPVQQHLDSKLTDEDISVLTITCSSCGEKISLVKLNHFKEHIHLSVLICKKCFDFYDDGNFSRDETGDKYCRWCADGGRMIACDNCTNAFCVKCIRRNTGRKGLTVITEKDNWHCFVCDPSPLEPHVKFCKRILKYVKREKKKREIENLIVDLGTSDSEDSTQEDWRTNSWAGPLLLQADNAIVVLNRRMAKVKRRLLNNSSKVNKCAVKFKELLSKHHQFMEYLLLDVKEALEANAVVEKPNQNGVLPDAQAPTETDNRLDGTTNEGGTTDGSDAVPLPPADVKVKEKANAEGRSEVLNSDMKIDELEEDDMVVTVLPAEENDKEECETNEENVKSRSSVHPDHQSNPDHQEDENDERFVDETNPVEECEDSVSSSGELKNITSDNNKQSGDTDNKSDTGKSDGGDSGKLGDRLILEDSDFDLRENSEADVLSDSNRDKESLSESNSVPDKVEEIPKRAKRNVKKNKSKLKKCEEVEGDPENEVGEVEGSKEDLGKDKEDLGNVKKGLKKGKVGVKSNRKKSSNVKDDLQSDTNDLQNETDDLQSDTNDLLNETDALQKDTDDLQSDTGELENNKDMENFEEGEKNLRNEKKNVKNDKKDAEVDRGDSESNLEDMGSNIKKSKSNLKKCKTNSKFTPSLTLQFSSSDSDDIGTKNVKQAVGSFLEQTRNNEKSKSKNGSTQIKKEFLEDTDGNAALKSAGSENEGSDEENERARKSLLSDLMQSPPEKARKRKRSLSSSSSLSDVNVKQDGESGQTTIVHPEMEKDEKLRCKSFVVLERLNIPDHELKQIMKRKEKSKHRSRRKCVDSPTEKTLDDEISRLASLPKENNKVSAKSKTVFSDSSDSEIEIKGKKEKITPKKKKCKSSVLVSSDSDGDMEVDSDDAPKLIPKQEVKTEDKSVNSLAKDALLQDSSDKSSSDSDVVSTKKKISNNKKSNSKPARVTVLIDSDSNSSDSDFVKKRKKYSKVEKLLKVPLGGKTGKSRSKREKDQDSSDGAKKPGKKSRTRNLISDSDKSRSSDSSSSSSDSDDSSDVKPLETPKKRKRIKNMSNSDSDVKELPDTPSNKGRKNIRKLLGDQELGKETKMASVAEKERRDRVKARQKLYNQVTEEGGDFGEEVTRKLVLETDPKSKEELVEVPQEIIYKLKPHQVNGVKFMWECVIESLKRLESDNDSGSGCVLAHCMGLGKTLQVITFVSTLLNNKRVSAKIKNVLVCCPLNTIRNWSKEFDMWLGSTDNDVEVFEIVDVKNVRDRAAVLEHWHKSGGVMIMSYEQFRSIINGKRVPKTCKASFERTLIDPGPDIIICDEGHVLKNESSALSKTMSKIKTRRRVVLTGTPLQNNLNEYHCMIQFVKPLLLGTKKEFLNRFINPISNGQCADSNQSDVKLMKKRVHILHKLLEGCVQRCDYTHVAKYLPPKYEFVISVRLSETQINLYRMYLERFSRNKARIDLEDDGDADTRKRTGSCLFRDFSMLRLIWTHPFLLQMQKKKADIKALFDDDSIGSFINDDSDSGASSTKGKGTSSDNVDEVICLSDDAKPGTSKQKMASSDANPSTSRQKKDEDDSNDEEVISNWKTRSRGNQDGSSSSEDEGPKNDQWWNEHVAEEELDRHDLSGKILLLFEILKQCELVGDKVLLFTQSLLSLDLLEELLQKQDQVHRTLSESETGDMIGTWVNGLDYFRMDGSTSADMRKKYIEVFNNPLNDRARLFMISTKAGSLGTNLVGANRVVILDASWNPTHDIQAIFRVYRFGQKKPVYIYRLLAQGAMEEKIYDRQVTKQSMAFRVVDEQQIDRHFNAADLEALYSFEPDSKSNRPTPMVPKDRLLAEMLIKPETKDWIVTYHEHDSLLENKTEEELTEDEKKVAWAEYEAQREGLLKDDLPGPFSADKEFLMEVLEEDSTGDLGTILNIMKQKRPDLGAQQYLNYIMSLDGICDNKHKELCIVSESLKKSNENLPNGMEAQIIRLKKLLEEIRKLKERHMAQQKKMELENRLRQEQLRQQRLYQQQQQQQHQQLQNEYQRMLHQQRLAQQQQQYKQRPTYFPATTVPNANPYFQGMNVPPARRPTVIRSNVNMPNGNIPPSAEKFGAKTYGRQSTTVTRGPIITEAAEDQPTSTANSADLSGPIITEID